MATTLTQARTAVAAYIDDVDADEVNETNLDRALAMAFHDVYLKMTKRSPKRFAKEASLTTSSAGVGDVSTLSPTALRILSVSQSSGNSRFPVPMASLADGPTNVSLATTLKISYIPNITFPASGAANFVWGSSSVTGVALADELLIVTAAEHAKIISGEVNQALSKRKEDLERSLENILDTQVWSITPLQERRGRRSLLAYVLTDVATLQLVSNHGCW